jgi:hypothetical protein
MRQLMTACGVSPKLAMSMPRGVRHLMPSLKKLTVGRGVAQKRLSDAEIAHNVETGNMTGGKARRHAPLKFRM